MTYIALWLTERPKKAFREKVAKEIEALFSDGLEKPEDLLFHIVKLTKRDNGPSVLIEGREDAPGMLFCQYRAETTNWLTVKVTAH